jgi:hyaluronoglucosaminidase
MSRFAVRGAIEGFYGRPYAHRERTSLVRFIGERGMNCYVYAPKNDPLHRDRWREPYAPAELAQFSELARVGEEHGVRVVYAIAPGLSYDAGEADFARLEAKLRQMHDAGMSGFALLFDDLAADSPGTDPDLQAEIVARVASLVASFKPEPIFWFIGNAYAGTAQDLRTRRGFIADIYPDVDPVAYYAAYSARVAPELPIMWTGPGVFSTELSLADAQAFRDFAARPVILWDNFPVNDAMSTDLFLGPYLARDPRLPEAIAGVVANLMIEPRASRIPLATIAEYLRDPAGYSPEAAWERAVREVGGRGEPALRLFAEQFRGHPVLAGATEAEHLGRLIAQAFGSNGEAGDRGPLRSKLTELAALHAELAATLDDAALLAEIEPWSAKLARLADAALTGLDAVESGSRAADYRAKRSAAEDAPQLVAADAFPFTDGPMAGLASGPVRSVSRFGDLFAAIDRALAGRVDPSTTVG